MKKKKKIIILIIFCLAIIAILVYKLGLNEEADTIIYGNIYTGVDGEATSEALAIKDDEYIYVGNAKDVEKYKNKNTKVIKYDEGLVLAGFTDTHTHVTPSFAASEYQIDLRQAKSVDEYKQIIKKYVEEHPNEEVYIGRGWDYMLFEGGVPTKDILDEVVKDKPIFIKSSDGHSGWVNSKVIELIGINKDTKNPIGGEIVRNKLGEPVGCFKDAAMDVYIKPNIKPYTVEQFKHLIKLAQEYYAKLGYTSYVEVLVEADSYNYNLYKAYEELDKEGELSLRVQAAWNVANNEKSIENVNKIIKYKEESKGGMFELTDIKIFMDGVAETKTAYFSEPYANDPTNYGADRWPDNESFNRLVDCIELANRNDVVVHFHAIGDAAITKALDAVEEARKRYVNKDIHNVITHLETVKESDVARFKKLDIVIAADLSWGTIDDVIYPTVEVKNLGEERAFKAYPYKTVLDAGAVVSSATDYPAGAVSSPIAAYVAAVTRNATNDEAYVRDPSQKMTINEALTALTYGGAYQMRQENIRGTIEVGKKADLVALDTNLLEVYSTTALKTKTLLNMVNGKVVYEANENIK